MTVNLGYLVDAVDFVSFDGGGLSEAFLRKADGEIFFDSEYGDFDPLPNDIEDSDKYIVIPEKKDLDLGKPLVMEFVRERLPDEIETVRDFFRKRGAYGRYKDLLDSKGLLNEWHAYEEEAARLAVVEWCKENDLEIQNGT